MKKLEIVTCPEALEDLKYTLYNEGITVMVISAVFSSVKSKKNPKYTESMLNSFKIEVEVQDSLVENILLKLNESVWPKMSKSQIAFAFSVKDV